MGASPKGHQARETNRNSGNGDHLVEWRTLQQMAMATQYDRGLSVVAYSNFANFVYLKFVTTRKNDFFVVGWGLGWYFSMSRRDKINFSWWGQGNFFSFEISHNETKYQPSGAEGTR